MARLVTLVVEDGTGVSGANSFVLEAQIVAHSLQRGETLQFTTDPEQDAVAISGIKASDYLSVLPWRGEVVDVNQTMPWPRKNLNLPSMVWPEDAVPPAVIQAQLQLTMLVNSGVELLPSSTGFGMLIKEKIGPIENVYSEKVGVSKYDLPILPGISGLLFPWLLGDLDGVTPVMIRSVGDRSYGR